MSFNVLLYVLALLYYKKLFANDFQLLTILKFSVYFILNVLIPKNSIVIAQKMKFSIKDFFIKCDQIINGKLPFFVQFVWKR